MSNQYHTNMEFELIMPNGGTSFAVHQQTLVRYTSRISEHFPMTNQYHKYAVSSKLRN